MKKPFPPLFFTLAFVAAIGFSSMVYEETTEELRSADNPVRQIEHLYKIMNCGLSLAAEGANMVLAANGKTFPSVDPLSLEHGRNMIASGRDLIDRTLNGPDIKNIPSKAGPAVKYLNDLGGAALNYVDVVKRVSIASDFSLDRVASQMQTVINHSVAMSAWASNVTLLGRKAITTDLDKFSLEHGQVMAKDARVFLVEVIKSNEMQMLTKRRAKDLTADVTVELSKAASKVIGMLEKRPEW